MSKKIIITGATGFIGQHLIPLFLNHNYYVIAISRNKKKASEFEWFKYVKYISLDFHKNYKIPRVNKDYGLLHTAWEGLPNYNSLHHFEKNLPYNYRFIKSFIELGVERIFVTGSCSEYGLKNGAIKSSSETLPITAYGLAKDVLRKQLFLLNEKYPFRLQWARLFYMYGKGQNENSIISQLDKAINNKDNFFNMTKGEQLRDYLSIENVTKKIFELYVYGAKGVYNICSGEPISVRKLVEDRLYERNYKIKLNLGYYSYNKYEPMAFWGVPDEFFKKDFSKSPNN